MNHVIFKARVLSHANRCPGLELISQSEVFNLSQIDCLQTAAVIF